MKRKLICFLLITVLLLCVAIPAAAEDYKGSDNWSVTYTGTKVESNFSSADIVDSIQAIQPGDSITVQVTLKNACGKPVYWYMANEVLKTLEDSVSVARGGAYAYRLSYINPKGQETLLYDSDSVGGDGSSSADGLHSATLALQDYFYLDTVDAGKTCLVKLRVALDGETQGDQYQNTLAKLQMKFACEEAPSVNSTPKPSPSPGNNKLIQTGDESHLGLWIVLTACSGAAVILLLVFALKGRRKEDDHE